MKNEIVEQLNDDQWDGTDIEPIYRRRYSDGEYLPETSELTDEYIRSYQQGDKFS